MQWNHVDPVPTYGELQAENAALKRRIELLERTQAAFAPTLSGMQEQLLEVMAQRDNAERERDEIAIQLEELQTLRQELLINAKSVVDNHVERIQKERDAARRERDELREQLERL